MIKQRRGVAGVPLCNHAPNCRWPRGQCPDARPMVVGAKLEMAYQDVTCACHGVHECRGSAPPSPPAKQPEARGAALTIKTLCACGHRFGEHTDGIHGPCRHDAVCPCVGFTHPVQAAAVQGERAEHCGYGGCRDAATCVVKEFLHGTDRPFLNRPMCAECAERTRGINGSAFRTVVEHYPAARP